MTRALTILLVFAGLGCSISNAQIVDCVSPRLVHAKQIRGTVTDPLGEPIPNASIKIYSNDLLISETKTDVYGKFSIPSKNGHYSLLAQSQNFYKSKIELEIGTDLSNLTRKQDLFVVLGIPYSFCPWATTNKKYFHQQTALTKHRLEEEAKRNATQK